MRAYQRPAEPQAVAEEAPQAGEVALSEAQAAGGEGSCPDCGRAASVCREGPCLAVRLRVRDWVDLRRRD